MHTITIDLNQIHRKPKEEKEKEKTKKILIAEQEPDIQILYSFITKYYGFSISDISIIKSGNKCLEHF